MIFEGERILVTGGTDGVSVRWSRNFVMLVPAQENASRFCAGWRFLFRTEYHSSLGVDSFAGLDPLASRSPWAGCLAFGAGGLPPASDGACAAAGVVAAGLVTAGAGGGAFSGDLVDGAGAALRLAAGTGGVVGTGLSAFGAGAGAGVGADVSLLSLA